MEKIKSNMKGAYSIRVPNQKFAELITEPLPVWYEKIREIASFEGNPESPVCTLRTMSILSQVYASKIQNLPLQPQIMLKLPFQNTIRHHVPRPPIFHLGLEIRVLNQDHVVHKKNL